MGLESECDSFLIDDLCCIALNKLPSKYICCRVDAMSHMTDRETHEFESMVSDVLQQTLVYLKEDRRARKL
ncbi:late competence development ComFB family protein [Dongshaea marina]|uniref:late competence development ComFB family protein n=1 Tax=Dongshaea marina TaxID=2047966 RepID=UPI0038992107